MKAGKIIKGIVRWSLWTIVWIMAYACFVAGLIYFPPFQDSVFPRALKLVSSMTGMDISAKCIRLEFPVTLTIQDLQVIENKADTMLMAGEFHTLVQPKPLLQGEVKVDRLHGYKVKFNMGTLDSATCLRADVDRVVLTGTGVKLSDNLVDLKNGEIEGARVKIHVKDTITPSTPPDPDAAKWIIQAHNLQLKDISYSMEIQNSIDSLGCHLNEANVAEVLVDMKNYRIHSQSIDFGLKNAVFIASQGTPLVAPKDTFPPTPDWQIGVEKIRLTADSALYNANTPDTSPLSLMTFNDITLKVDSFINVGSKISLPLRQLHARWENEKDINVRGQFDMDSLQLSARDFKITTPGSKIELTASMRMGDFATAPLKLLTKADISEEDTRFFSRLFMPTMSPLLSGMSVGLNADLEGSMQQMEVYDLTVNANPLLSLNAQGIVSNLTDFDQLEGELTLSGHLKKPLAGKWLNYLSIPPGIYVPAVKLDGSINYEPGEISGDLTAVTHEGRLLADGHFVQKREGYEANIEFDRFRVDDFIPSLGVGSVTAIINAQGEGFNFLSPSVRTQVAVELDEVEYNHALLTDLYCELSLEDGLGSFLFDSTNPEADLLVEGTCDMHDARSVKGDSLNLDMELMVNNLDLVALRLDTLPNHGSLKMDTHGWVTIPRKASRPMQFGAEINLSDLDWTLDSLNLATPAITLSALSTDSLTHVNLVNGDLDLNLVTQLPLLTFLSHMSGVPVEIDHAMKQWSFNGERLQKSMPPMVINLNMGADNMVARLVKSQAEMDFSRFNLSLTNDSIISMDMNLQGLNSATFALDTINFFARQKGEFIRYYAMVDNQPGTMDEWAHLRLGGYLSPERLSASFRQENLQGEKGFSLGFFVTVKDSLATLKFQPHNPTIAYKKWKLNADNFISYNLVNKRLKADLALENDLSYLRLFTRPISHADSLAAPGSDEVVLQLSKIHLQDWLSVSPFSPPIKGDLNGDMAFAWNGRDLTGSGTIGIKDLYYGPGRVGDFDLGVDMRTNASGVMMADVSLMVDSVKTITARGAINDSTATSPFLLDFNMVHFPLKVLNPFIGTTARLSGMLNGTMKVTGDPIHPIFNGYLDFDTTAVQIPMLGAKLRFSEEKVPIDSNIVYFNDFSILAANKNPLLVNGTVNVDNLSNLKVDLSMIANNMQLINTKRSRGADIYGKASIDLNATAKGDMRWMNVKADLALLEGSNVTYVIPDASAAIAQHTTGTMIHFVNLSDTSQVQQVDTIVQDAMMLNLDATLSIRPQTTITVDLSTDGKNRAQIEGAGTLNYSISPFDGDHLNGKFNLLGGFVRYSPPLMSEKRFDFQEGSFISFNGNMLNPTLNVKAVDRLKANVTQQGQNSRLVNFDIILSVTGTLETMKVAFDLTTDDDITVKNELQGMSPEQRANQAMNMLLYNVYTGAGTTGSANLSGNPLYSFLESTLNTWIANNIRGVDISFGIDQYDKTYEGASTAATSYSYQVSKTLFNDRVKIVVGGNYSTDANADENFSQNLINDISFEYMLTRSGSMYLKLFRHTGYESILEGEVTQTGVGFVIKRSLNSLWDLFRVGSSSNAVIPKRKEEK